MVVLVGIVAVAVMKGLDPATGVEDRETIVPTVEAGSKGSGELAAAEARRAAPAAASAALVPVVAEGRTELREGMFVLRHGDSVMVHFDTPDARTRRRDKFERTLRSTLRQVYGATMDTVLATQESLLAGRDLVGDVAVTGLRLPLPAGRGSLAVWPRTRPGQDGPLVVSYVAVPVR
jgi:hypothetical protein